MNVSHLQIPDPAAVDEGNEHLRLRNAHLELKAGLEGLSEPVPRIRTMSAHTIHIKRSIRGAGSLEESSA